MEVVAQVAARLGPDLHARLHRVAHLALAHLLHEQLLEPLPHRLHHDEALGGDAALAAVDEARRDARLARRLEVGVLQDQVRIAAPQLEYRLLDHRAGLARDRAPGGRAARQGHRLHLGGSDDPLHALRPHEEGAEERGREAGVLEDLLDGERAAGHVGRVLEEAGVAGHEGGRGEAEHLPEWEIPRHDREHGAEGQERHEALAGVGLYHFRGEEALGVVRVVAANPRALLRLRPAPGQRLAHLDRHQAGQLLLALVEQVRRAPHPRGPVGEARPLPSGGGAARFREDHGHVLVARFRVLSHQLVRGGIDGFEAH